MKLSIRSILFMLTSFLLLSSCLTYLFDAPSLPMSDIDDLLNLPINWPTQEKLDIMFEDPDKIIVYHGFACGEMDKNGYQGIIRMQGRLDELPEYVNKATVLLNGWNSEFLNSDHDLRIIGSGIINIDFSERENDLTWDAFGALSDKDFKDPYSWCYYYTIVAWNDNQIDAFIDDDDEEDNISFADDKIESQITIANEIEVFQNNPNEKVAILPRGYGVVKSYKDLHLLQYGYYLDYKADLESPQIKWESNFIYDDDSADNEFYWFEGRSYIGGQDIGVIKNPFSLDVWDDGDSGFDAVNSIQNEYVVENINYEYAIPLLTGWDLYYPQDEEVEEIGIWIEDFDYIISGDKEPGTLTYSLVSILKDKNGKPKHAMDHNVTVLAIKERREKSDSPVTITTPVGNILVDANTPIVFDSTIEEGTDLNDRDIEWHSSIDGLIGVGKSITVQLSGPKDECNPPYVRHKISILVKNKRELRVEPITIKVGKNCD